MNRILLKKIAMICGILVVYSSIGLAGSEDVLGVIGLSVVESSSCVGVWLSVPEGQSLAGVRWYNNDGTTIFPGVYLMGGDDAGPGELSGAQCVAEGVQGGSLAWSEVLFTGDYIGTHGGLYVIFQLPYASVQVSEGEGGGAGVGYQLAADGATGWMSLEGEEWSRLHATFGFAVEGITTNQSTLTVVVAEPEKSLAPDNVEEESIGGSLSVGLIPPHPNPLDLPRFSRHLATST